MNAFTSLKTLIFSILFATLLVLSAAQTPSTSSAEDVEPEQQLEQQKGLITPEEYITPEIIEQTNHFWPPVHLRGLRSSNGKPTFIRFGKRASPSFIRFGRK